jgi:hypothetical protein
MLVEARFSTPVQTGPGAHPAFCTMGIRIRSPDCQTRSQSLYWLSYPAPVLRWAHTCNVTTYRNTISWQCGWTSNVSKVDYVVTLLACSMHCWYLVITSKGWYGYSLSRSGRARWHVTTIRSSRLLAPVTNWEPHGVTLARYCYTMRHGVKIQITTLIRVVTCNVTALRYVVMLLVCTHL